MQKCGFGKEKSVRAFDYSQQEVDTSRSKRKLLLISLCQFMIRQIIKNTVEFPIQSMK